MSKPRPKASKKDVKDGDQVFMLVKMEKYLASVIYHCLWCAGRSHLDRAGVQTGV